MAQHYIVNWYGDPGIVSSTYAVTVAASGPQATKGRDSAAFTSSRADGDWSRR